MNHQNKSELIVSYKEKIAVLVKEFARLTGESEIESKATLGQITLNSSRGTHSVKSPWNLYCTEFKDEFGTGKI